MFVVFQLKSRCEELKLDWGSLCLDSLLKEKQALRKQISEKQKHCLELQVHSPPPQFVGLISKCLYLSLQPLVYSSILAVFSGLFFHPAVPFRLSH